MNKLDKEAFVTEFVLDETLSQIDDLHSSHSSLDKLIYNDGETVHESKNGDIPVLGHMDYLEMAYNSHKGIYLTHENVWLIVLSEIAAIVAEDPETYRHLFTDSDEKEEILVEWNGTVVLAIEKINDVLKEKINVDHSLFFPKMNKFDELYDFAAMSSFADVVSPYYEYSMFLCGFPKIRVVGSNQDWKKIYQSIVDLSTKVFIDTEVANYLNKAKKVILEVNKGLNPEMCAEDRVSHWKNIFGVEHCGSGGQVEVTGWIQGLYHKTPSPRYTHNYATSISKVDYTIKGIEGRYEMFTGLLSCSLEDKDFDDIEYLRPNLECIVRHLKD